MNEGRFKSYTSTFENTNKYFTTERRSIATIKLIKSWHLYYVDVHLKLQYVVTLILTIPSPIAIVNSEYHL